MNIYLFIKIKITYLHKHAYEIKVFKYSSDFKKESKEQSYGPDTTGPKGVPNRNRWHLAIWVATSVLGPTCGGFYFLHLPNWTYEIPSPPLPGLSSPRSLSEICDDGVASEIDFYILLPPHHQIASEIVDHRGRPKF